jgi:hypothetical protein
MGGAVLGALLETAPANAEDARQLHSLCHALTKAFGDQELTELSSDAIEGYLRYRLRQRVKRKTRAGIVERGVLKPSTVHQDLRVLRRILDLRDALEGGGVGRRVDHAPPRQGDAKVFKQYSQMQLQMKREALTSRRASWGTRDDESGVLGQ